MPDETKVETTTPEQEGTAENKTVDNSGKGDSAGNVQPSGEKSHWYRMRQMERLKKKQDEEIAQLKSKLDSGELQPDDSDVHEALQAKDVEIKKLQAERMFADNEEFKANRDLILDAITNPKYASFTPEEIAKFVLADQIIASKASSDSINAHSTGTK